MAVRSLKLARRHCCRAIARRIAVDCTLADKATCRIAQQLLQGRVAHLDNAVLGDDGDRRPDAQEHLRQQALDRRLLLACLEAFGDVAAEDNEMRWRRPAHLHQVEAEPERAAIIAAAQQLRAGRPFLPRGSDDPVPAARVGILRHQRVKRLADQVHKPVPAAAKERTVGGSDAEVGGIVAGLFQHKDHVIREVQRVVEHSLERRGVEQTVAHSLGPCGSSDLPRRQARSLCARWL